MSDSEDDYMSFKVLVDCLGKSKSGIKEPIDIKVRQGTSGIGRESHLKEVVTQKQQLKLRNMKHYESQYRLANKERKNLAQIRRDFFKAQKVCEELDYRINIRDPVEDFFWTKETIKKRRKMEKSEVMDDTDSSDEDEEFEMSKHLYCLYCVITGIDIEDLKENCPGPYRMDHDGDLD
ncbi:hypothetical protein NQ317_006239 [Molorchus minor]|uniref:DUF4187 domain-containing protein n=1 Tax=Molorchus minor TaxID=1323400 RepID=A0ABQ9K8K3_9CUCU|nr:hypothetical protein NQ317_006239 [Molorchus minor]